jgi:hypothetical protein
MLRRAVAVLPGLLLLGAVAFTTAWTAGAVRPPDPLGDAAAAASPNGSPAAGAAPAPTATAPPAPPGKAPLLLNGQAPPPPGPDNQARLDAAHATVTARGGLPTPRPFDSLTPEEKVRAKTGSTRADMDAALRPPTEKGIPQFEHTKGTKVMLGPREVQLPPDAGLDGLLIGEPSPFGGMPRELRFTIVRQGNARAFVGHQYGQVEQVDPPAASAQFDWLRLALLD